MTVTARRLSVVSATSCARRRLIRSVRQLKVAHPHPIDYTVSTKGRFENFTQPMSRFILSAYIAFLMLGSVRAATIIYEADLIVNLIQGSTPVPIALGESIYARVEIDLETLPPDAVADTSVGYHRYLAGIAGLRISVTTPRETLSYDSFTAAGIGGRIPGAFVDLRGVDVLSFQGSATGLPFQLAFILMEPLNSDDTALITSEAFPTSLDLSQLDRVRLFVERNPTSPALDRFMAESSQVRITTVPEPTTGAYVAFALALLLRRRAPLLNRSPIWREKKMKEDDNQIKELPIPKKTTVSKI